MTAESKKPLVIAHRGARDVAPENTIKACQLAIESGANGLELDIRPCGTGEIVLYHDAFLNNHFKIPKRVGNVKLDFLKTLEFNNEHYKHSAKINTLKELFEEFKYKVPINLEAKVFLQNKKLFAKDIIKIVEDFKMTDQIWISSFNPHFLKVFKSLTNKIRTGLLFRHLFYMFKSMDIVLQSDAWHPHFSLVTKGMIKSAKKLNKELHLWTIKKKSDVENISLDNVHGIITDIYDQKF
jgi:glycerophosphoryl diester phosphodiesterase